MGAAKNSSLVQATADLHGISEKLTQKKATTSQNLNW